jgi:hypothetical protein
MKWFKHISDSLDDPFIFDLVDQHGPLGYMVFFGVLEIYAREFKTDSEWRLRIKLSYLRNKLQRKQDKLLKKVLKSIDFSKKWSVNLDGEYVEIYIPKFAKIMDETTLKKLREAEHKSGIIPEPIRTKDLDLDLDLDIKPPKPPLKKITRTEWRENLWYEFITCYPRLRATHHKKAHNLFIDALKKAGKESGQAGELAKHLEFYEPLTIATQSEQWTRDGGKWVPAMHRWFEDELYKNFQPAPENADPRLLKLVTE